LAQCKYCQAQIKWDQRDGRWRALELSGLMHDCPNRPQRLPERYKPSGPTVKLGAPPAYGRGFQAETITKINHIYERMNFLQAEIVALQHEMQRFREVVVGPSSDSDSSNSES
jgi:hypothetical protein